MTHGKRGSSASQGEPRTPSKHVRLEYERADPRPLQQQQQPGAPAPPPPPLPATFLPRHRPPLPAATVYPMLVWGDNRYGHL